MTDYGGPRRGGLPIARIAIALVIALFGIISYYSHTEKNPVTGEVQRVGMNPDQEKALGLQAAPQVAAQMGGAVDPSRDASARRVAEIGAQLAEQSDVRKSNYADNFHFLLLDDRTTVNAFALPGGQVFITRALFDRLDTDAELAGVLGHEVGHVINRHGAEHMAKGQLGQMLVGAVAVGTSDDQGRGQLAAMAAQMANQMLQLQYSRKDELESDAYGMKIMTAAGYDPSSMRKVMDILKKSAGTAGRGPNILQTHPDPDARIAQIEQILRESFPQGIPPDLKQGRPLR